MITSDVPRMQGATARTMQQMPCRADGHALKALSPDLATFSYIPEDTIITVMLRYMNPIMFPTIRILTESNMLYEQHASITLSTIRTGALSDRTSEDQRRYRRHHGKGRAQQILRKATHICPARSISARQ